jgi:hypothetical protein
MKLNIFMNTYQQPENKLTYSFLVLIEYLNDQKFIEWLVGVKVSNAPIINVSTLSGGGAGNPDGCFEINLDDNKSINVFLEIKTRRRSIDIDQLKRHIGRDDFKKCDKLLVITPRLSDRKIIENIGNEQIIFKAWNEISTFLSGLKNSLADQFINYGIESGEFEGLGELSNMDIKNYINTIEEKIKIKKIEDNFFNKINLIFTNFVYEYKLFERSGFSKLKPVFSDKWGRMGMEINYEKRGKSYGQWFALSLYYDTKDHNIDFKNKIPEIVFFFDVNKDKAEKLRKDNNFRNIVCHLIQKGFESNLDNEMSNNKWRLLLYRKSISDFENINIDEIGKFADEVFNILNTVKAKDHPYFKDFI